MDNLQSEGKPLRWKRVLPWGFSIGLGVAVGVMSIIGGYLWYESPPNPDNKSQITTAFQLPTATEVFHLRSECASLGEKILENNHVGSALTQSQTSHYDPQTNRCYVELTVQTADLVTPVGDWLNHRYLYDGQTGELLAVANMKGTPGQGEKRETSGMVFVPIAKKSDMTGFEGASLFIDSMMADDRKR